MRLKEEEKRSLPVLLSGREDMSADGQTDRQTVPSDQRRNSLILWSHVIQLSLSVCLSLSVYLSLFPSMSLSLSLSVSLFSSSLSFFKYLFSTSHSVLQLSVSLPPSLLPLSVSAEMNSVSMSVCPHSEEEEDAVRLEGEHQSVCHPAAPPAGWRQTAQICTVK